MHPIDPCTQPNLFSNLYDTHANLHRLSCKTSAMRALCVGGVIALLVCCAPLGACDLSGALDYMASRQESYVDELKEFVALPSVSGALDKFDSMRKTAEWVAVRLRKAGFQVRCLLCRFSSFSARERLADTFIYFMRGCWQ